MFEAMRSGRWASKDRLVAGGIIAIALYSSALVYLFGFSGQVTTQDGVVLNDFLSFWVAAKQALQNTPVVPYRMDEFAELQSVYLGEGNFFAFFYPPTFLLLVMPLGKLSAMAAFVTAQLVSLFLAGLACSRILRSWHGFLLAAALPAAFNSVFHGQSALLCAALLGAGLVALTEGRMILAGVFIGILTIKPQMGVLIPFALLAGGYYRTFLSAAVTALLFALLSWAVFGAATWLAFFEQGELAKTVMELGQVNFHKMVSIFGAARLIGLPPETAYGLQAAAGIGALVLVCIIWRRPARIEAKAVVLISAGYLATPFALSYDLAALAMAAAFAIRASGGRQELPWMWTLVAVACVISVWARYIGEAYALPIGPLAPMILLWIGLRQCSATLTAGSGARQSVGHGNTPRNAAVTE